MPSLITRGAFTAKGFGFGYVPPVSTDGTFSIISGQYTSGGTNKYTYATNSAATATSLSSTSTMNGAAGTGIFGIFNLNSSSSTNKYTYSNNSVSSGSSLSFSTGNSSAVCGNSTIGIFAQGTYYNNNCKYTWANGSVSSATSVGTCGYAGSCGNSTTGLFVLAYFNNSTVKYNYSNDSTSSGTNVTSNLYCAVCVSNSNLALICFTNAYSGGDAYNSNKYTWSNNAVASRSSLTNYMTFGCGSGNSTMGFLVCGGDGTSENNGSATQKYIYSSDSTTGTSNLTYSGWLYSEAASNGNTGVFT